MQRTLIVLHTLHSYNQSYFGLRIQLFTQTHTKKTRNEIGQIFSITKNHVNFRMLLALMIGISRYFAGTRSKHICHSFELKDGGGIGLFTS